MDRLSNLQMSFNNITTCESTEENPRKGYPISTYLDIIFYFVLFSPTRIILWNTLEMPNIEVLSI
jgi:hypothetical protein